MTVDSDTGRGSDARMSVLTHGIDLVEIARVAAMVDRHGERFLDRCFTEGERAYAEANQKRSSETLAARFAAKEAVLKAIGTGWRDGIKWTDVEVVRLPSGQPTVSITGEAGRIAAGLGITRWAISLSHTDTHAMASAVGTGDR